MLVSGTEYFSELGIVLASGSLKKELLWQLLVEAIALSTFSGVCQFYWR